MKKATIQIATTNSGYEITLTQREKESNLGFAARLADEIRDRIEFVVLSDGQMKVSIEKMS